MIRLAHVAGLACLFVLPTLGSAQEWGTIKGQITFGGPVPEKKELNLGANPDKLVCEKNGPLQDETWVVNPKNKGLKHAFVWLAVKDAKAKGKDAKLPIHPNLKEVKNIDVQMDQPACAFIPHAIAIREGQNLIAKNGSTIGHNFKYTGNPNVPENAGNNFLLPPGAQKKIEGLVADRLPIAVECNIHPWMKGWVRVFDHPYFAVTDEDGKFEIKDAPAGDFRILVWHGSGGWLGGAAGRNGKEVTIKSGANDLGTTEYPPPQ
ncbi:MAG: hypothetical protein U0744_02995 [Gemmataceae bacterium]